MIVTDRARHALMTMLMSLAAVCRDSLTGLIGLRGSLTVPISTSDHPRSVNDAVLSQTIVQKLEMVF